MMPADLIYVLSSQRQRNASNAHRAQRPAPGRRRWALLRVLSTGGRRS
jgi:hypothetical protein